MQQTDGSNARFLMSQMSGRNTATIDLMLGAIGAALQLATQEAASVAPEHEVRIYQAITAAVPAIVDSAMDHGFVISAIGASPEYADDYKTLLRNTEDPIAGAALRAGQVYRGRAV